MQTYFEGEQASLFAPDTFAGRMSQAASAQARRTGRISGLSWRKLLDYIAPDYQFLDLSSDAGNLLGQYEWTTRLALHPRIGLLERPLALGNVQLFRGNAVVEGLLLQRILIGALAGFIDRKSVV